MDRTVGIYIHVPFCAKKCPYCDFYSTKYNISLEEKYFNALISDIILCSRDIEYRDIIVDTIYFGGGTPSLVKPLYLKQVIDCIKENFNHKHGDTEITIEANPCTITDTRMKAYADMGINRISFGMQSASEKELTALGRTHNLDNIKQCVSLSKNHGINNISLDFMIGTPYQTIESVNETLAFIKSQDIKHVSAYMLKVEQDTPFYASDIVSFCPDEDLTAQIYLNTVASLNDIGLTQYEISNFAVKGYESQHNLKYWNSDEYLGFGTSAHSFYSNARWYYKSNIDDYINDSSICKIYEDTFDISTFEEYAMLKLRLTSGLDLNTAHSLYQFDETSILKSLKKLLSHNLITYNDGIIALTPSGFLISNSIISELLF